MNKRLLIVISVLSLVISACGSPITPDPNLIQIQTPKPVIFDTDMAHEDIFSALFLLSHPNWMCAQLRSREPAKSIADRV